MKIEAIKGSEEKGDAGRGRGRIAISLDPFPTLPFEDSISNVLCRVSYSILQ